MKRFARHIIALASFAGTSTAVVGQELTANRSGVEQARIFARNCLHTAPTFSRTEVSPLVDGRPTFRLTGGANVELREGDGMCTCVNSFVSVEKRIPDFVQNLHYVVKDEARLEWQSAKTDPTEILLDYDGTPATVRVASGAANREPFFIVSAMVEREGSCPQ